MTQTQPITDANKHHDKKGNRGNNKDRRHQRPQHAAQGQLRRSAADLIKTPPRGFTVQVFELEKNTDSRKRARLLVLESENGWKVLPFMSVRIEKRAQTTGSNISVFDDMDLLPNNIVESAIEVGLLSDDVILSFAEVLTELREKQRTVVPAHKRPFVQRPFAAKLAGLEIEDNSTGEEEDEMAKSKVATKSVAKHSQTQPKTPKKVVAPRDVWWFASVC